MDVYSDLKKKFETLTEDEKNILLIYKSRLGLGINYLDDNKDDEIEKIYSYYQELLNDPINLFMKMTVFKDVPFDDYSKFKEYLYVIRDQVEELSTRFEVFDDVVVYRAVSIKENELLKPISKGNIISTSLSVSQCLKFFVPRKGYKHYLYQLNLKKGTNTVVCPYAIMLNSKTNQLTLTHKTDQEELILNKNEVVFDDVMSSIRKLDTGDDFGNIIVNVSKNIKNNTFKNK